jgi:hypothetical protein
MLPNVKEEILRGACSRGPTFLKCQATLSNGQQEDTECLSSCLHPTPQVLSPTTKPLCSPSLSLRFLTRSGNDTSHCQRRRFFYLHCKSRVLTLQRKCCFVHNPSHQMRVCEHTLCQVTKEQSTLEINVLVPWGTFFYIFCLLALFCF